MHNILDTSLTDTEMQQITDAFNLIKSKVKFGVGLTDKERTGGWIRSPHAIAFMKEALQAGKQTPANFPGLDMAAFERDLLLIDQTSRLENECLHVMQLLKDTRLRLTQEGADQAFFVYRMMKVFYEKGIKGGESYPRLKERLPRTGKKGKKKKG